MSNNPYSFFQPKISSHNLPFTNYNHLGLEDEPKIESIMQLLKELSEQDPLQGSERT